MQPIVLNTDQEEGFDKLTRFFLDPFKFVFKLKGHSGTGKSTLISHFLSELPNLVAMAQLLNPSYKPPEIKLTATTHQACEALLVASGGTVGTQTIHSLLGLTVCKDHMTGKTSLEIRGGADIVRDSLIFMDEASFADQSLIGYLFTRTDNCKFVLMGDHGQLTPVGSTFMPAFEIKGDEHELTKLMRQQPGPLADLCEALRHTVFTGVWPTIQPDGNEIVHMQRKEFGAALIEAFKHPEIYGNTKVLAYTNQRVIDINKYLSNVIMGTSDPQIGQRMMVNTAIQSRKASCNTGEEVFLEDVRPIVRYDLDGWNIKLRGKGWLYFLPRSLSDYKARLKLARSEDDYATAQAMDESCIDLRPAFACTVNKAQGSTFDTVFVDLDDICQKVRSPNQLARILYVAFSRTKTRLRLTGDM